MIRTSTPKILRDFCANLALTPGSFRPENFCTILIAMVLSKDQSTTLVLPLLLWHKK